MGKETYSSGSKVPTQALRGCVDEEEQEEQEEQEETTRFASTSSVRIRECGGVRGRKTGMV